MGVSVYPRLSRPIPGVDPLAMVGKPLSRAFEELEATARSLGVTPLPEFVSVSQAELDDAMREEDPGEDWEPPEPGPEDYVWFDPTAGLVTVDALLEHVRKQGDEGTRLVDDLLFLRSVLQAAVKEGVQFNLGIDI